MTDASFQCDGLRVVAPDGCTVADSAALQGFWTEAQYLALTNGSNRLLEFTDGHIEVLPVPTRQHQAISQFLFLALYFFVRGIGGNVFYAPLRLRIREGKFRDPDLLLVTDVRMGGMEGAARFEARMGPGDAPFFVGRTAGGAAVVPAAPPGASCVAHAGVRFEADGTLGYGACGAREAPFLECQAGGLERAPGG